MTIADSLTLLNNTKTAIKEAIEDKGVTVGAIPFADYAEKISEISGGGPSPTPWVRPADWLTLPTVLSTDQKFVGLHAIYPDANFVALSAAGDYTVDWGDGTVENFAANAVAEHEYNYATYDVAGTTLCSRGYKQAIVTVTPQSGQSLTSLNLHQRHSALSVQYSSGFLDIALASTNLSDLRVGVRTPGSPTQALYFADLEQVSIVKSDLRTLEHLFYNCIKLQSIVGISTSAALARNLNVVFSASGNLVKATGHGLRNGDTVVLKSVTTTTGVTTGDRYFVINATPDSFQISSSFGGGAVALTSDGSGVFAVGTSFSSMFSTCSSLQTIPALDTSQGTSFNSMFSNCYALQSIPALDTSQGTSFSSMFSTCSSLQTIPALDTSQGRQFNNMFSTCYALQSIPALDTSQGTSFSSMFTNCFSLQSIPALDTSQGTSFSSMFFNCYVLHSIPALDTSQGRQFNNMFSNCQQLSNIDMFGMKASFSVQNCKLSADRLNEIYTNLATVSGQTITVTGNYGAATDDPSIATAKGWTVTG